MVSLVTIALLFAFIILIINLQGANFESKAIVLVFFIYILHLIGTTSVFLIRTYPNFYGRNVRVLVGYFIYNTKWKKLFNHKVCFKKLLITDENIRQPQKVAYFIIIKIFLNYDVKTLQNSIE